MCILCMFYVRGARCTPEPYKILTRYFGWRLFFVIVILVVVFGSFFFSFYCIFFRSAENRTKVFFVPICTSQIYVLPKICTNICLFVCFFSCPFFKCLSINKMHVYHKKETTPYVCNVNRTNVYNEYDNGTLSAY